MGHKHGSIVHEFTKEYKSMAAYGESKHQAKKAGTLEGKIFSFNTMKAYKRAGVAFGRWCKQEHGCKTVLSCRDYVADYLTFRMERCSAYTVKLDAASLAKLYRCRSQDFGIETPARTRPGIQRSRKPRNMDKHFSETRNAELVNFCRCTGLRRCELSALTGNQVFRRGGSWYIHIERGQGKGGRERDIPIIGTPEQIRRVVEIMRAAGDKLVFPRVHAAADIHGYRAEYAAELYRMHARPLEVCRRDPFYNPSRHRMERNSVYYCRNDERGRWFDKRAMLIVSRALGHNRISVVGEHYLYNLEAAPAAVVA